jgi:hypothetical protein
MEAQKVIVVSPHELRLLINDAVSSALTHQGTSLSYSTDREEWGGIPLAQEILKLAESTIYANIRRIPHEKKHGRLYFNRGQLLDYLAGKSSAAPAEFERDIGRLSHSRQKRRGGLKADAN